MLTNTRRAAIREMDGKWSRTVKGIPLPPLIQQNVCAIEESNKGKKKIQNDSEESNISSPVKKSCSLPVPKEKNKTRREKGERKR
jgi:hypothetical protein